MALQNIGSGNKDDAFYRYKMPKMITKIEGRGNGIKTNVVNMVDIAKALARPASYTTKYFGCELGAQSKFDEKTGISLVNGAHDTAKLAGLLENFIKKYVQCYGCSNPETEILITKTQLVTLKCAACGFVSDVDMKDKLTNFILKNPPEQKKVGKDKKAMRRAEKERLKEGEAADEEQKKLKKEAKKKVSHGTKDVESKAVKKKGQHSSDEDQVHSNGVSKAVDDEDEVQWQTDTSAEAAKKRMQEQLTAATAEMVMLSTNESTDEKMPRNEPESQIENDVPICENFKERICDKLKSGCTAAELKLFLESLSGSSEEIMTDLFEALFSEIDGGLAKAVAKKRLFVAAGLVGENSQMVLLQAIEAFFLKADPDTKGKEAALVMKALYDADLLEEECVLDWYKAGIAGASKDSRVWHNVKPFIEWLESAESESE